MRNPAGKHPLSQPLAGWNTLEVLGRRNRVVYRASVVDGIGCIEVLCIGPRSNNEIYDMALSLARSGLLTQGEITDLWDVLAIFDIVAEDAGLDGWDFRPPPAPEGMVKAVVASGVLPFEHASAMSQDELTAAMSAGFGPSGPDPRKALQAALARARSRITPPAETQAETIVSARARPRCGAVLPRALRRCIRRQGHPGAHRAQ